MYEIAKKEIKEYADAVRRCLGDDAKDMRQSVERLGGRIECDVYGSMFGQLELMNRFTDGFVIHTSVNWSSETRNMAIAFELGHLFLHTNYADAMAIESDKDPILVSYYK